MPVMAVIEIPGGSRELDVVLLEAWHSAGYLPQGDRLLMAGPMDGGWRVVGLWDSASQIREFIETQLDLSFEGGDGQPAVTLWEIETVHYFDRDEQRSIPTTDSLIRRQPPPERELTAGPDHHDGLERRRAISALNGEPRRDEWTMRPMTIEVPDYTVLADVLIDPERTALVVVDMQNDFVKKGGNLLIPDAEATVPAIKHLLEVARANRMRIVYSQDTHREGDREWETWPEHCREGSWGWEIVSDLAPETDDTVIGKLRFDAFYGTPLDHLLRLWGVETLVICGTVANISVQWTAASAAQRWHSVVIPRDAISALEPFDLEASLRQIALVCGGQITTATGVRMGGSRRGKPRSAAG